MLDTETKVTAEVAAEHGLTADEYARILQILGREPNLTELGIFSVMWSEHCSYKSSKVHLRRLPTAGARVVQGPGENAGVVDIGDGLVAVFKIESHNHPSFVEPFQGAATGVGGILRDIFTMGARPIAVLDPLRFGPIVAPPGISDVGAGLAPPRAQVGAHHGVPAGAEAPAKKKKEAAETARLKPCPPNPLPETTSDAAARNRRILDGVISGIAFYGNCFGVATVGGEIQFEPCYSANPLVNVLALGIARREELFFARARGAGNPVIYVGAKTGRDGIHGASLLASAEFSEESQQKRPNVQVGDPFMEKLLLEACLEAMRTGAVVAIQDMGAAGLTCSTCEMGSRGGTGVEIELDRVPQRETGMTPYEIMLSESQERMLLVAERGREREVLDVFAKWGLDAVEIGRVTSDGLLRVRQHGRVVAEIPAHPLAEEGPVYQRPMQEPPARTDERLFEFVVGATLGSPAGGASPAPTSVDLTENFRRLLASPAIASKRWVYEQYDTMVRTNTLVGPGAGDAAIVRVKGSKRALALATDGNGRWCWLDPYVGAQHAVAEAARNVACCGARPVAATNCLNFGNPEKPEVMWQFARAVDGIATACRALDVPITGGNVSFYNETLGRSIYPTPVLGVLGVIEDASHTLGMAFRNEGDVIVLLEGSGEPTPVSGAKAPQGTGLPANVAAEAATHKPAALWVGASAPTATAGPQARALAPEAMDQIRREFSSSEYAKTMQGIVAGSPPPIDLVAERRLIDALVSLAGEGLLHSAHDVSDGGLAVTVAESCFAAEGLGADITLGEVGAQPRTFKAAPIEHVLFGERGARAVVSCAPRELARVAAIARQYGVAARQLGRVSPSQFRIQVSGGTVVAAPVASLREMWATALERALKAQP